MLRSIAMVWVCFALGCGGGGGGDDAGADAAADASPSPTDAGRADTGLAGDAGEGGDAGDADAGGRPDAAVVDGDGVDAGAAASLAAQRDALFATVAPSPCEAWGALDPSARAVFLTITHRAFLSRTPDGRTVLSHLDALYAALPGGADGRQCGGTDNNRLFLSTDVYLWELLVAAWSDGDRSIEDGGGGSWARSSDLAGPHDPFTGSTETETGLDCILLIETGDSRPPTAQAHFFLPGDEVAFERGGVSLPSDPQMLEVDLDFDCLHRSNPLCPGRGFDEAYAEEWGDYECDWVPAGCTPDGEGCHRGVE